MLIFCAFCFGVGFGCDCGSYDFSGGGVFGLVFFLCAFFFFVCVYLLVFFVGDFIL